MDSNLSTQISLVISKYENIEDTAELISLLYKEFNVKYNEQDILNHYISITDLEIENRKIEHYGYFDEYTDFDFSQFNCE